MFNDIPYVETKTVCDDSSNVWEIYVEYDFYPTIHAWNYLQQLNSKLEEISELLERENHAISFITNKTSRFAGNAKITFYNRDDFLLFKLKF